MSKHTWDYQCTCQDCKSFEKELRLTLQVEERERVELRYRHRQVSKRQARRTSPKNERTWKRTVALLSRTNDSM